MTKSAAQTEEGSEMNEPDKTTNATPSAVEEVKRKRIYRKQWMDYVILEEDALDLATRLDCAQFDRDSLNVAYSTAEAALKEAISLILRWRESGVKVDSFYQSLWEETAKFIDAHQRELEGKGEGDA